MTDSILIITSSIHVVYHRKFYSWRGSTCKIAYIATPFLEKVCKTFNSTYFSATEIFLQESRWVLFKTRVCHAPLNKVCKTKSLLESHLLQQQRHFTGFSGGSGSIHYFATPLYIRSAKPIIPSIPGASSSSTTDSTSELWR